MRLPPPAILALLACVVCFTTGFTMLGWLLAGWQGALALWLLLVGTVGTVLAFYEADAGGHL